MLLDQIGFEFWVLGYDEFGSSNVFVSRRYRRCHADHADLRNLRFDLRNQRETYASRIFISATNYKRPQPKTQHSKPKTNSLLISVSEFPLFHVILFFAK